jgi:hypothetical protein
MGLFSRKTERSSTDSSLMKYIDYFTEIADDMYVYDHDYENGMKELWYRFRHEHRNTIDGNYMVLDDYKTYYIYERKDGLYEYVNYTFSYPRQALVAALIYWNYGQNYVPKYYQYLKSQRLV